jgi:hypothetical protein
MRAYTVLQEYCTVGGLDGKTWKQCLQYRAVCGRDDSPLSCARCFLYQSNMHGKMPALPSSSRSLAGFGPQIDQSSPIGCLTIVPVLQCWLLLLMHTHHMQHTHAGLLTAASLGRLAREHTVRHMDPSS